jgi:hypothetical protein
LFKKRILFKLAVKHGGLAAGFDAIFLTSILPFFETINVLQIAQQGIPLRMFVWIVALFLGWGRRLLRQTAKSKTIQA